MQPRVRRYLALSALALAAASADDRAPGAAEEPDDALSLTEVLAGEAEEGYARALEPRPFVFPEDHGAHEEFRNEWWYFTGNLTTAGGRRFGYQYTLFRSAVAAEMVQRDSQWASRQVYMAHFALSDIDGGAFHAYERFSRGGAGLAGVELGPFRAWLTDWKILGSHEPPPFQLQIASGGNSIELELGTAKPMVLNGDRGLSQKGREPGNASYYYSFTRMPTRGTVTVGFKSFEVQGSSWLDREWSTSALESDQTGWDWFALQLSDGSDLMVYQLRRQDGSADPSSSGTFVEADGSSLRLTPADFELKVRDEWTSPASGTTYPSGWQLSLKDLGIDVKITPLLRNQELDLTFRYWEGAVRVEGTRNGLALTGRGYVELTGYDATSTE